MFLTAPFPNFMYILKGEKNIYELAEIYRLKLPLYALACESGISKRLEIF